MTQLRGGRRGTAGADGFTALEFVVASALIVTLFLFSAKVLSSASATLATGLARDNASSIAYRTLEKARAFGCGLGLGVLSPGGDGPSTDVADPAGPAGPDRAARCARAFGPLTTASAGRTDVSTVALAGGDVGVASSTDADFDTVSGDSTYTLHFRTSWRQTGAPAGRPYDTASPAGQPNLLVRDLVVAWKTRGGVNHHARFTTTETSPPDATAFQPDGKAGILVSSPTCGTPVTLRVPGNPTELTRLTDGDPTWTDTCTAGTHYAWFPYLPAQARYMVSSGAFSRPVDLVAGRVEQVSLS